MSDNVESGLMHFNSDYLLEIIGGDEDFIIVLVKTFFENFDNYINEINIAIKNKDHKSFKLNAHSLKGSARSICFEKMANYFSELEDANIEQIEEINELLLKIKDEYVFLKNLFEL